MDESKGFCETCNEEKDIIEIEIDPQKEIVKFSCGHRLFKKEFTETIGFTERFQLKHKNAHNKLLEKYRTQIGRESGKPAKWIMKIDREQRKIIHSVEEQNENGEWEVVHDHAELFEEKKK